MGLCAFDFENEKFLDDCGFDAIMTVEDRPIVIGPRLSEIREAIAELTPDGGPSFLIVERPDENYAQIAGGDGVFAFEQREYKIRRFRRTGRRFRHWAAGRRGETVKGRVSVLTNGYQVPVRSNENLNRDDVMVLFEAFLNGEKRSTDFTWRDMTEEFLD